MYPLSLIDGALFIDNSSLERFTTCPRSAQYYICQKREGADERVALTFGKKVHELLETRYQLLGHPVEEVSAAMHTRAQATFSDWSPPEGDFRTYDCATQLINAYLQTYPLEEFTLSSLPSGAPAIEVPFAVPIGEIDVNAEVAVRDGDQIVSRFIKTLPIVWTGRIDLIYESQGRTYLMDHKTTSMLGPQYFKEFELSHQVYGYTWAASRLLNRPVYGFCVNALAVRRPTKTGKSLEFVRQIVPLDQSLLEEWIDDTLHICSDFVENARRGYFPKHTKWCIGKYGECPYRGVCSLPPDQRELMLMSSLYKNVEWSPLK